MLENHALPSWKFSTPWQILWWKVPQHIPLFSTPPPTKKSPWKNSLMESSPTYPPLLNPSPDQKIPLKTSVHFPITITTCKHWSKFVTYSPSHGDCGGVSGPQRHSYKVFRLYLIKWLSQNFDPVTLRK